MEIQAGRRTQIPFADVDRRIPHQRYMMRHDSSFDRFSEAEIYGTAEYNLVNHSTSAPATHHVLDYTNEAIVQFTRYLFIIDFISYSLQ